MYIALFGIEQHFINLYNFLEHLWRIGTIFVKRKKSVTCTKCGKYGST